jgi:hypothetical protein
LVEAARLAETACLDEATCGRDLLSLGEPLKMSDNQPALLTPIGRSTKAAITAITVRQPGTTRPEGANFLTDDGNPRFPRMILRSRFVAEGNITGILIQELLKNKPPNQIKLPIRSRRTEQELFDSGRAYRCLTSS